MKTLRQRKIWLEHSKDKKYQEIRDNITESFKDLIFEEGPHKYYLNGVEYPSVTNLIHIFKPPFHKDKVAKLTCNKHYENPDSIYYHKSVEEILEMWEKNSKGACDMGSERHNFGESVFWWMLEEYDKINPNFLDRFSVDDSGERIVTAVHDKEESILNFWSEIPDCYIPILAENRIYNINEYYGYSGTFDILFYYDAEMDGRDEKYSGAVIFDYKTNKDLYKNYGKKLLEPFQELVSMDYNVYQLQLAAYQLALERIGIKVVGRRLIWLVENGEYRKIGVADLSKRMDEALKFKLHNNNNGQQI